MEKYPLCTNCKKKTAEKKLIRNTVTGQVLLHIVYVMHMQIMHICTNAIFESDCKV